MDDTQMNHMNKEIRIVRKRKKMKDRETGNKREMDRNPQGLRWSTQRKRETERHEDTEKEHGQMDRCKDEECKKRKDGWINAWIKDKSLNKEKK